jgi:hypothetical protein
MAEALGEVLELPVRSVSYDVAAEKWGPFVARFNYLDLPVSNKKAREQLKWEPRGPSFLEDIVHGSYRKVANGIKNKGANA